MNELEAKSTLMVLQNLVTRYSVSENGTWLGEFDWKKIPVEFKQLKNNVLGKYSFGRIILHNAPYVEGMFPIYVHELRHRWQWHTNPIMYIIGKIFFLRPFTIEKDAYHQEDLAEEWLNNQMEPVA